MLDQSPVTPHNSALPQLLPKPGITGVDMSVERDVFLKVLLHLFIFRQLSLDDDDDPEEVLEALESMEDERPRGELDREDLDDIDDAFTLYDTDLIFLVVLFVMQSLRSLSIIIFR